MTEELRISLRLQTLPGTILLLGREPLKPSLGFMNDGISSILGMLKVTAWIALVFFALRLRLLHKYPIVFVYVFAAIALDIFMNTVQSVIGTKSLAYSYLYVGRSLTTASLACAVLFKIFVFYRPFNWRTDWHMVLVPTLFAVFLLSDSRRLWFYFRLLDIGYATLTYFGVVAVTRMRRSRLVLLGWNLKMVLLALTLPAAIYSFVFVFYTLGLNISKEDASLWMNGISVAAWIILAVGMTEYSPPVRVPAEFKGQESHPDVPRPKQKNLEKIGVDLCGSC